MPCVTHHRARPVCTTCMACTRLNRRAPRSTTCSHYPGLFSIREGSVPRAISHNRNSHTFSKEVFYSHSFPFRLFYEYRNQAIEITTPNNINPKKNNAPATYPANPNQSPAAAASAANSTGNQNPNNVNPKKNNAAATSNVQHLCFCCCSWSWRAWNRPGRGGGPVRCTCWAR